MAGSRPFQRRVKDEPPLSPSVDREQANAVQESHGDKDDKRDAPASAPPTERKAKIARRSKTRVSGVSSKEGCTAAQLADAPSTECKAKAKAACRSKPQSRGVSSTEGCTAAQRADEVNEEKKTPSTRPVSEEEGAPPPPVLTLSRNPKSLLAQYLEKIKKSKAYTKIKEELRRVAYLRFMELHWRRRRLEKNQSCDDFPSWESRAQNPMRSRPWDMSPDEFHEMCMQRYSPPKF